MVDCPICGKPVREKDINDHIDSGCQKNVIDQANNQPKPNAQVATFFQNPTARRTPNTNVKSTAGAQPTQSPVSKTLVVPTQANNAVPATPKRPFEDESGGSDKAEEVTSPSLPKRQKQNPLAKVAPLAERMRPRTLDEVYGQDLVGPSGVIRGLIEQDRVPSMILWGGPGTGKTTIARLIAHTSGSRFIEINSTSSGVGECKKLFAEARTELSLTGRKTIIFCDEIHRFSKSQQDVFLGPVEAGQVTLIGATTENPSFKVVNALLSRCRTFTLAKLTDTTIVTILERALAVEHISSQLLDRPMLSYLAAFSDGDARTALNLLELATDLSTRPSITPTSLKQSLTQTLVYDRAGDQHYDTISAFHKSVRGSDPDAALYYLARMLQSGEDPLYVARRLVVIASEDVGLADNTALPLATAAYAAAEKIGMPEARIPLAHATVALSLAPKSTRAYRGLAAAYAALREPGVAGLPVPTHLRNAPTRLMKEMGFGREYKYNPDYREGRARQEYLPEKLVGRRFLEENDLGTKVDPELEDGGAEVKVEEDVEVKVDKVAEVKAEEGVEEERNMVKLESDAMAGLVEQVDTAAGEGGEEEVELHPPEWDE